MLKTLAWWTAALAWWGVHTACEPPRTSEGAVPYLSGGYSLTYRPSSNRYLNDHTIIRGPDMRWHVIGITDTSLGQPQNEKSLLHASAPSLDGPWREEADALSVEGDEVSLWAPHIVSLGPSQYASVDTQNRPLMDT